MKESLQQTSRGWRIARRVLLGLAIFATLIALFYLEEDWRGKQAWEQCKRELAARGANFDWSAYVPAPVPAESNVFGMPEMQRWLVRQNGKSSPELSDLLKSSNAFPIPLAEITHARAVDFIETSRQFAPQLELIRQSLERPFVRLEGDYQRPWETPVLNFISYRFLAQNIAHLARCYLVLHQPDKALDELRFLRELSRLTQGRPTVLVSTMIDVAVTGLYLEVVQEGLRSGQWDAGQIAVLQSDLQTIDLPKEFRRGFEGERIASLELTSRLQGSDVAKFNAGNHGSGFWQNLRDPFYVLVVLAPHGWLYQNMVVIARWTWDIGETFDATTGNVSPHVVAQKRSDLEAQFKHFSPFRVWAALALPNFDKASQVVARNQTMANETIIVCALERYRLARGDYPDSLDALSPEFLEQIPHDLIGGQSLKYDKTADGKFILYSIGWNEKDDGGQTVSAKSGTTDFGQGDWVWPMKIY